MTDMIRKADNVLLPKDTDLDRFVEMLADTLNRDRHPRSTAYIDLHRSLNGRGGAILVYKKEHEDNPVIRLHYHKVNAILEYDAGAGDMFDISDRLVDLAEEGGAL
ncbi:MAG: hypothetical protein J6K19_01035 [Prevotella sp.]|nr:hypothetical protein [Prevotella sp.]